MTEREPDDTQRRLALLHAAQRAVAARAYAQGERLLHVALGEGVRPVPADPLTFAVLRLLGESTRKRGDLSRAAAVYLEAQRLAVMLGMPGLESGAVEGLAMVARVNDDVPLAVDLLQKAARLAQRAGDEPGRAAVLSNLGDVLMNVGRLDEAESAFREALDCPRDRAGRAITEDNLAQLLARDGRVAEAIPLSESAAADFGAEGMQNDRYIALCNLSRLYFAVGDSEKSQHVFAEAHALIHQIAASMIDPEHYERYPERVREIEAETSQRLSESDHSNLPVFLEIGLAAHLGEKLVNEGEQRFEAADYDGAERALLQALANWEHLGAIHAIPRVHQSLGMLYVEVGQPQRALSHLLAARRIAEDIGDAYRERNACINLCRLVLDSDDPFSELDVIELIARARALQPIAMRQQHGQPEDSPESGGADIWEVYEFAMDFGVLDSLDAAACINYHALDLAEAAIRRSVAAAERLQERLPESDDRLAMRLVKLHHILTMRGKTAEAAALGERLDAIAARDPNPRTKFVVHSYLGVEGFRHEDWSAATLARLMAACDAYEELHGETLAIGELGERKDYIKPPFAEAVEVALQLGRTELAFHLLERSKARSLLAALRGQEAPAATANDGPLAEEDVLWHAVQEANAEFTRSPDGETPRQRAGRLMKAEEQLDKLQPKLEELWRTLSADHPTVIAHRMARPVTSTEIAAVLAARPGNPVLIELFTGPRDISAFVLDGSGELRSHRIAGADDEHWSSLWRQVTIAEADDGDITQVLGHPALAGLSAFISEAAAGRPAFIIPYGILHRVPLHLIAGEDGKLAALPQAYHLPSASMLCYPVADTAADGTLIGGDPLGDLPFASLEAAAVADKLGTAPALGAQCDPAWLARHLAKGHPPLQLVHLACHAVFHPRHAERSGILLAGEAGAQTMNTWKLAALDWSSQLTVLSACSSGQHQVRTGDEISGLARTLLASGVRSLIVALWSVPDLATYLVMKEFYGHLPAVGPLSLTDIATALTEAQGAVRDLSAQGLLARAIELRDQATTDGDERLMICAMSAIATAHRGAGNHEEWLRWREAIQCRVTGRPFPRDIGHPHWDAQCALGAAPAYAVAPFADPRNWAAFVLISRG